VSTVPLEVRGYRRGDEHRILDACRVARRNLAANRHAPSGDPVDLETWRWLFERNPAGRELALAVHTDGEVAGHRAGIPQIVDTDRGTVRFVYRTGPVRHPGSGAGDRQGVADRDFEHALMDAPRERCDEVVYRVAAAAAPLENETALSSADLLVRAADNPPPVARDLDTCQEGFIPSEVNALYRKVLRTERCLVRRDRPYLHWRYVDNPARRHYEVWAVRRRGALAGLMVLRPYHDLIQDAAALADWLVPASDSDAASALIAVAARRTRACRRHRIIALATRGSHEGQRLAMHGFAPAAETLPARECVPLQVRFRVTGHFLDEAFLQRHWTCGLGDTDLV